MHELLGIGWYLWLFFSVWLISKVVIANFTFRAIRGKRYILHFPLYFIALVVFTACVLNHPYQ
jgi:hypothetical protein